MTRETDEVYIKALQGGDTSALVGIMELYQHKIFSLIMNMVKNEDDATELTQDVFLKVYDKSTEFRFQSKFSTWLYRIAYNTSLSFLRKKKLDIRSLEPVHENEWKGGSPDLDSLREEERNRYISMALEKLGPQQKLLIQLFYLEELTVKEIIEITNIPESSVKTGLLRARNNLFRHLQTELKEEIDSLL